MSTEVSDHESPQLGKRKHEEDPEVQPPSKRSRKRNRTKKSQYADEEIDEANGLNLALGRMNPDLLADYVGKKTKRFEDKATLIELEERRIPVAAFMDTTEYTELRTLDKLPAFLEYFSRGEGGKAGDLRRASKQNGSPHTLIVTAAGLRAADITRSLRTFQSQDAIVAKLFAKHIKISESTDLLKKKRINIGVGTPTRLIDLLKADALKVDSLERVLVDASHVDVKKRGILDMRETLTPLIDLLNRAELKARYMSQEKRIQLLIY